MTGYADLETAISALKLGASDFILKPFNLEQMLQAVQRCMNKRLNERLQYALQRDFSATAQHKSSAAQYKPNYLSNALFSLLRRALRC